MKARLAILSLVLFTLALAASAQEYDKPTSSLRKGIIPLAGSTAGANGAHFKTSLRIYAAPDAHGKIVFHPLGTIASDSDPSVPYSFAPNAHVVTDYLEWDDVVAAMGQSGLGTLDIIPDSNGGNFLPPVITRIYNDTPNGTFGTEAPMVLPRDYFFNIYAQTNREPSGLVLFGGRMTISPMGPNYRRNIGMRTLSDVQIVAIILRKNGKQETSLPRTFPGDYSFMMPVEQFVQQMFTGAKATTPLTPEDGLQINAAPGHAITYYTYTDNRTNDPALVVSPADEVNVMLEKLPNP